MPVSNLIEFVAMFGSVIDFHGFMVMKKLADRMWDLKFIDS